MAYNFDNVPNRRIAGVLNKWTYYPRDKLPLWVADMDFPAPQPILDELRKTVNHGVFGYELASPTLLETVAARMDRLYRWKVQPDSIVPVTGIVSGFNVAARAFGSEKKGYLVQPPVYNEFREVKNNVGIPQIDVPFIKRVRRNILRYEIDWDLLKAGQESQHLSVVQPTQPPGNPLFA